MATPGRPAAGLAAGELLRTHRLRLRLTQHELAGHSGVSVRAVRDIERGRVDSPRGTTLDRLVAPLGLSDVQQEELYRAFRAQPAGGLDDAVQVAILGPISVRRGGRPRPVGAPLQRTLFGLLALRYNELVTTDEIVDTLWGEDPPRTCLGQVQTMVGRLRRLTEPAVHPTGETLRWLRRGYLLQLDDQQIDVGWFEALVRDARRQHAGGDVAAALAAFDEAMKCWRGAVLADTNERLRTHPAATALHRRHLEAVLAYADAAADAGRDDAVIGCLEGRAAVDTLHEGLHARLILALARTGDYAGALRQYAVIGRALGEELGVEPGPELHRVYHQLLRERSAAPEDGRRAGHERSGMQRPAQLPADVPGFVGREELLAQLDALLRKAAGPADRRPSLTIVTLSGSAGVGKTSTALHWAHRIGGLFPDGQLYVNLCGFGPPDIVMAPTRAIRIFLDALGVPAQRIPADFEAQAALYRSLLAGRRVLVVLDNARDAKQVRPLLPGAPGCLVVVTSRNRLSGLVAAEGAYPFALDLLTIAEARDLVAQRIGARALTEPAAVDQIIASCAQLPLALAIATAQATTRPRAPLGAIVDELRDARDRLDVFASDDPATDLRAVFSWSCGALSNGALRLFRLLGLHPGPDLAARSAASIAGLPLAQARALLAELTSAHLIIERAPGRHAVVHDLLRAYANELIYRPEHAAERRAATHRMLDHYLHAARSADRILQPQRHPIGTAPPAGGLTLPDLATYDQAVAWFAAEYAVLLGAIRQAAVGGFDSHAWQLAWSMTSFFDLRGHWRDWTNTHSLALAASGRCGDRSGQAHLRDALAHAHVRLGEYDAAQDHLEQAVKVHGELDDTVGLAGNRLVLGWVHERRGRNADALAYFEQALGLFRGAAHQAGQARALNAVGWAQARLGNHEESLARCQEALRLQQSIGDPRFEAETWAGIGQAYRRLGQYDEAARSYQRAADMFGDLGDRYMRAGALARLGGTQHTAGRVDAARHAWRQALAIFQQIDHVDADQVRAKLLALPPTP